MMPSFDGSYPQVVAWTRGAGCAQLATLLATEKAARAEKDLVAACVALRPDLVVMRKTGSFDLVSTATPSDFDPDRIGSVCAAVAGGPHSLLAARVATRLATALDVDGEAVSVHRGDSDRADAEVALDSVHDAGIPIQGRLLQADSATEMIREMPPGALLVLGAPGGSWLHRQFLGPGARMVAKAPTGAVVVRAAPIRAFQLMGPSAGIGGQLAAREAAEIIDLPVVPVCQDGQLVGVVRRKVLEGAPNGATVDDFVEPAPFTSMFEPLEELVPVAAFLDQAPVPVVDRDGKLVGAVDPADLPTP